MSQAGFPAFPSEQNKRQMLCMQCVHLGTWHCTLLHTYLDVGLAGLVDDVVGHQLLVTLHLLVGEGAADEALDVVDGARGVDRRLVLGGVADQALAVGEGDIGGRDAVALVVGDDLCVGEGRRSRAIGMSGSSS